MTTVINCNHAEMLPQFFVTHEPVEVCGGSPSVQQHKCGCARRTFNFSEERGASPWQLQMTPRWQMGNEMFAQFCTFKIVTDTLAPFSSVTDTLLPALLPRSAEPMGDTGLITSAELPSVRFSST